MSNTTKKQPMSVVKKMMIALVSGLLVGIAFLLLREQLISSGNEGAWTILNKILFQDITAEDGVSAIGLFYIIGQLFMRGLQLAIVPLVLVSLSLAMCSISSSTKLGRIAGRTLIGFFLFYVCGAFLAGIVAYAVKSAGFFNVTLPSEAVTDAATLDAFNPLATIVNAVPSNIAAAFSSNNSILAVVVVAIIIGLCSGTFPQVNAITESVHDSFHIPVIVIGIIVTVLTAVVTLGGIQAISKVAQFVVPFMAISFIGGSMVILIVNHSAIPGAFAEIFSCAFSKESALGGAAGTAVVSFMTAMRTGVARGVYTNEAGLGSSPIVAAAAKTDSCVKQGLISMTSVFFTTILTCSMTGLVVISSGLLDKTDLSGSVLVTKAYNAGLPFNIGMYLVAVGIIFFSFTTILGWNYYGERCVLYLTGKTGSIKIFKIVYILAIATAPFLTLEPIWLMADITNALMIIPNLIALLGLRKVVISETKKFFDREERTKVNVRKSVVE